MLTVRQHETFQFIEGFITKHGYAPTTLEIAQGIGIRSKGVAHRYVRELEQAGLIHITPHRRRNISLINSNATNDTCVPLCGKIAAGCPIEAVADHEEVDLAVFTGADRYALKVCGNSMIDEGIHDGDVVICQRTQNAPNGSIVVALIDNECATLKRLQRNENNTVTLIPANAEFLPTNYDAHRVHVQGIFIGLVRFNQ